MTYKQASSSRRPRAIRVSLQNTALYNTGSMRFVTGCSCLLHNACTAVLCRIYCSGANYIVCTTGRPTAFGC
jgi:hypothetical protein